MRIRGTCDLILTKDKMRSVYKCPSGTYWLEEEICDARQARGHTGCSRCPVRKGGKDDPRPNAKTIKKPKGA